MHAADPNLRAGGRSLATEVVTTVAGDIPAEQLGRALTHEHVLTDLTAYFAPDPDPAVARDLERGVRIDTLGHLRRSLTNCADDLVLNDDEVAVAELGRFVAAGGEAICEVSCHGIRQADHARRLLAISRKSSMRIVLGTGAYVGSHHGASIAQLSEDDLHELFTTELDVGVGGTAIRCGVLGEIGLSTPPLPREEAVLRAAGRSAVGAGVGVIVHQTDPSGAVAHHALDILEGCGVPLARVAIAHAAVWDDWQVFASVLSRGCYVAIDTIGLSGSLGRLEMPSETGYETLVRSIIDAGLVAQLLVSQDVCHKRHLRGFGGVGYDHILRGLAPRLAERYSGSVLRQILVDNPRALLARPAATWSSVAS